MCKRPFPEPRATLCASLRSRTALGRCTSATLYGNLQEKCRRPKPRRRLCASLCSRNGHQHVRRATLHGNLQGKGRRTEFRPAIFSLGVHESPFWRFHKSHSWDHPIRNQLLEEEVGMTHHESKKVVLKREKFPPKSCSSSQSTFQSATSWMIIMHPTCCRNSPGLMLTLALALFIYHEILILDVTSQENQRCK